MCSTREAIIESLKVPTLFVSYVYDIVSFSGDAFVIK